MNEIKGMFANVRYNLSSGFITNEVASSNVAILIDETYKLDRSGELQTLRLELLGFLIELEAKILTSMLTIA